MKDLRTKRLTILVITALLFNVYLASFIAQPVQAASNLVSAGMMLYRMQQGTAVSSSDPILVVARPATTDTETQVRVTFAAGFSVAQTVLASTANLPTSFAGTAITSWPLTSSLAVSHNDNDLPVVFSSGDISTGTLYGFFITSGVTNPTSTGGKTVTIATEKAGPTEIDSSRVGINIVGTTADQVVITASVPPTFSFALASTAIALGDLNTSAPVLGMTGFTVSTNANNGWTAWLKGSQGGGTNAALHSTLGNEDIDSQGTVAGACTAYSASNEFYNLDANVTTNGTGGGTPGIFTPYNCTNNTEGGTLAKTFQEVAYSNGPGSLDAVGLTVMAAMSGINKAADDYTDTWTVVGAGNF